ncbi:HAD family hydrolase [Flectobacillus rivi]|uniref:phosphoglycolate phosphatase n=1 Tax=Flectobacillus rivi TaxID=2984209 RepID=A0ABT6YY87_9BACT|nr:HAD hydrolase-like protein [Flectobacillus rivi]MDI9873369.1 HAD hydrolase-like protein [Flectobacillus rivi]
MKSILKFKVLLWDFDGVIMDSMPIRGRGFEEVLLEYPKEQVKKLMAFHNSNGGLSRYVKFRYFFEVIRGEVVSEERVLQLAGSFSNIMFDLLLDKSLLISDSVEFIKDKSDKFQMHIVSGSDGKELTSICEAIGLANFFKTINGSPTPKTELVKNILQNFNYNPQDVALIGDSINDFDAAVANGITFIAYNNIELFKMTDNYIKSFKDLDS